jgi:membrane protease subunit HflK
MSGNDFKNPWDNQGGNIEEKLKQSQQKIVDLFSNAAKKKKPSGNGSEPPMDFNFLNSRSKFIAIFLIVFVTWLSTGFYTVQPEEQGVVIRIGKYNRTSVPGLNYKMPSPIEEVVKVSVTRVEKEEIGFRSKGEKLTTKMLLQNTVSPESQMLTTDENIVDINFEVQWRIIDAKKFLFNVRDIDSENTVKNVAESAMREVIGLSGVTEVLAEERSKIEQHVKALMQTMLNNYDMGVNVERVQLLRADPPQSVIDAYRDVQNAKQDKEKEINQAYAYRNDIVPRARGQAEQVLQDADGYKQQVIAAAKGDAARFNSIYDQYKTSKEVTRKRIYIETMEEIMGNMDKIIVDKGAQGVVPYLPLNELTKKDK